MDITRGLKSLRRKLGLIPLLLLGISTPANAQPLWKGTQAGMSLQDIQRKFPEASRPTTPTHMADGSRELLRLPNTIVVGHTFDALFFFKQGALRHINLELQEQGGAAAALQTFRGIKNAFNAKYGPPDDEQDQTFDAPAGPASFRSASWRSGRTLITLSYATAAGGG